MANRRAPAQTLDDFLVSQVEISKFYKNPHNYPSRRIFPYTKFSQIETHRFLLEDTIFEFQSIPAGEWELGEIIKFLPQLVSAHNDLRKQFENKEKVFF